MILQKEYTFWQWQFSCNCQYLVMNYFKFYTVIFCRKPKQLIGAKNKWTNWLPKIFYYIKETHTTDRSVILVVILEMVMTLEHSNPFRCWEGHFPGQTLSNTDRFFFPFFFFFRIDKYDKSNFNWHSLKFNSNGKVLCLFWVQGFLLGSAWLIW